MQFFVFGGYNPQELLPDYEPPFLAGELLLKVANPSPIGEDELVVMRLEDGHVDSVWPEEVVSC